MHDEQKEIKQLKLKNTKLKKENAKLRLSLSQIVIDVDTELNIEPPDPLILKRMMKKDSLLSWIKKNVPWNKGE